jgi:hypothetical protein
MAPRIACSVSSRQLSPERLLTSHKYRSAPAVLGSERLPGETDRRLDITETRELVSVPELRRTVVRRQRDRTAILRFRSAPVEVDLLKQNTRGNMRGG